jgi:hypothetical protein
VLVEFLVELVDFLADGVPEVNNGHRTHSEKRRVRGRFLVGGSAPKMATYGAEQP